MLERMKFTQGERDKLLKSAVILVDTREHDGKNNHILNYFDSKGISWKKQKLDYCDYSIMIPANDELGITRDLYFTDEVAVERKANLDEFAQNCTKERERIKKEFTLAPPNKIIVIENATYADMIQGNYRSEYSSQSQYGTVHSFWHEFNIPFFFIKDPKYTGCFIAGYLMYYLRDIIK